MDQFAKTIKEFGKKDEQHRYIIEGLSVILHINNLSIRGLIDALLCTKKIEDECTVIINALQEIYSFPISKIKQIFSETVSKFNSNELQTLLDPLDIKLEKLEMLLEPLLEINSEEIEKLLTTMLQINSGELQSLLKTSNIDLNRIQELLLPPIIDVDKYQSLKHHFLFYVLAIYYKSDKPKEKHKTLEQNVKYLNCASELGNSMAKVDLALHYKINGENLEKVVELLEEARTIGNTQAMLYLGYFYQSGEEKLEIQQDVEYSKKLYQEATDKKNADAMFHLGWLYRGRENTKANFQKAEKLLNDVENLGKGTTIHESAIHELVLLYLTDIPNITKAIQQSEKLNIIQSKIYQHCLKIRDLTKLNFDQEEDIKQNREMLLNHNVLIHLSDEQLTSMDSLFYQKNIKNVNLWIELSTRYLKHSELGKSFCYFLKVFQNDYKVTIRKNYEMTKNEWYNNRIIFITKNYLLALHNDKKSRISLIPKEILENIIHYIQHTKIEDYLVTLVESCIDRKDIISKDLLKSLSICYLENQNIYQSFYYCIQGYQLYRKEKKFLKWVHIQWDSIVHFLDRGTTVIIKIDLI
jgi:TPR repeat protein